MIVINQLPQCLDGSLKYWGEHSFRKWRCSLRGLHSPEYCTEPNSAFQNVKGNSSQANTIWCICSLQFLSEPAEKERTFQSWNVCMPHCAGFSLQALKNRGMELLQGTELIICSPVSKKPTCKMHWHYVVGLLWGLGGICTGQSSQDVPKAPFKRQLKWVFLLLPWRSSEGLVSAALRRCNSCWVPARLKINCSKNSHRFVTEEEQSLGQQHNRWRHLSDV